MWIAFIGWAAVVAAVSAHHQPWFDEAQAWLIARDSSLASIFTTGVRYEGTPALWHALLWTAIRLGLPYSGFWLISLGLASIGSALVLFRAPFPIAVRLGVVCSYFFAYQYVVVARSYAIDLAAIPALALLFPRRTARPLAYFGLLGLVANTNAHSFVVASLLALEASWASLDLIRARSSRTLLAIVLFGAMALAAALQAYPPNDINFLIRKPGERPWEPIVHAFQLGAEAFLDRWDFLSSQKPDVLSRSIGCGLSALLLAPSFILFKASQRLALALALFTGLIGFSAVKYGNAWHAGIIFMSYLFCLWISWRSVGDLGARTRRLLFGSVAILLAIQTWYALAAGWRDYAGVYSPARQAASVLPHDGQGGIQGRLGVAGFKGFALQPYFTRNVFANYKGGQPKPAYYVWSKSERPIPGVSESDWRRTLAQGYDRVLLSSFNLMALDGPYRFSRDARVFGYCLEAAFGGELIWKTYALETDDMVIYRRCPPWFRRRPSEILAPEGNASDFLRPLPRLSGGRSRRLLFDRVR